MNIDHAERVHSELLQQAAARQAYEQQQQPLIPMRRDEPVRMEDQPIGDEQKALLAEFDRRRRVRNFKRFLLLK